jgi:hypothetical protein
MRKQHLGVKPESAKCLGTSLNINPAGIQAYTGYKNIHINKGFFMMEERRVLLLLALANRKICI